MTEPSGIRSFFDIPGWFRWLDKTMFDALLQAQPSDQRGDLVELGVYLGKSAVVLGCHLRNGERLVVVDLFGTDPGDHESRRPAHVANRRENAASYSALERERFESNYLALHEALPVVITGLSSSVVEYVPPRSARFVHVDAGHMYENVRVDVANTRQILQQGGVAVFDDYRSEHTPGVAAAVWEGVVNGGLTPFAVSPNKLYGSYGDPSDHANALRVLFDADERYWYEEQEILGHPVIRAKLSTTATPKIPPPATLDELQTMADEVVARVLATNA